ncbi:PAS domain S-box-containing protein/diguanylate cyclase (GGDEF) domain-containing protein [Sphingomonas sp. NFR04]|uniref:GGDEF domain-containing protein n=1 Tax=Sphingomonas sp. NFR04 TaxID=1566283 RepID=UPI0008E3B34D|nr:sensor domain-containing diguanylate cyclase [Sphingomonas sp. NFR04]SFK52012.1 PAS domain S-box-containing protein/diguanylate cyclase (GGDEF) domain-containing protein [Sphingomonas sp. NFR04]
MAQQKPHIDLSENLSGDASARTGASAENAVYRTLLESTRAIPWKIDWATMRFEYIGPQIESLLGWPQDSWVSVEDWASRIHPDEREHIVNYCVAQSIAGLDHEADYRALTQDRGFVWIRDVVHVVRNADGEVDSLIGFMFDISERKRIEQELMKMQRKLEALSFEDGLTRIANRRRFDERLEACWDDARRTDRPLSMILLDIDHFKGFNDRYGHVRGDECLVSVAAALKKIGREQDVVARFGGEEFVLLLPETDEAAALDLARRCCQAIEALSIPNAASDCSPFVTASLGVGTVFPSDGQHARDFCESVDRLLYGAKQNGRNQLLCA